MSSVRATLTRTTRYPEWGTTSDEAKGRIYFASSTVEIRLYGYNATNGWETREVLRGLPSGNRATL